MFLLALLLCGWSNAQPTTFSEIRALEKPHGSDVFVRFFGNNSDMLVYNRDNFMGSEVFTCRKAPDQPSANRYVIPLQSNTLGGVGYTVTDMVVVGNMCYFCGRKDYATSVEFDPLGLPYYVYDTRGFVGQISLDQMTDNQGSAVYRLVEISATKEVSRMDAKVNQENPSDTLLALVGKTLEDRSCLVFTTVGTDPYWSSSMVTTNDTTEWFTDVVFTDSEVMTASRFDGEHYLFGLRGAFLSSIANSDYSDFHTVYTFNTSNMVDNNLNINTTWHTDDVDIRLSASSGSYIVNVAYESFAGEPVGLQESFTTMFRMQMLVPSDIYILYLQNVQSGTNGPGALTDMLTMDALSGVALLHRDMASQPPKSIVQMVPWGSVGTLHSYASVADHEMTSLDKYGGTHLWAAGHQPNHQDSVVLFYKNLSYPLAGGCYTRQNFQRAELVDMVKPIAEQSEVNVNVITIDLPSWFRLYAQPTLISQRCYSGSVIVVESEEESE